MPAATPCPRRPPPSAVPRPDQRAKATLGGLADRQRQRRGQHRRVQRLAHEAQHHRAREASASRRPVIGCATTASRGRPSSRPANRPAQAGKRCGRPARPRRPPAARPARPGCRWKTRPGSTMSGGATPSSTARRTWPAELAQVLQHGARAVGAAHQVHLRGAQRLAHGVGVLHRHPGGVVAQVAVRQRLQALRGRRCSAPCCGAGSSCRPAAARATAAAHAAARCGRCRAGRSARCRAGCDRRASSADARRPARWRSARARRRRRTPGRACGCAPAPAARQSARRWPPSGCAGSSGRAPRRTAHRVSTPGRRQGCRPGRCRSQGCGARAAPRRPAASAGCSAAAPSAVAMTALPASRRILRAAAGHTSRPLPPARAGQHEAGPPHWPPRPGDSAQQAADLAAVDEPASSTTAPAPARCRRTSRCARPACPSTW
jgi:hypothetical protein